MFYIALGLILFGIWLLGMGMFGLIGRTFLKIYNNAKKRMEED